MSSTARLFVAISLPREVVEQLKSVGKQLPLGLPGCAVKPVRPELFHITIKFLGDVPATKMDDVIAKLRQITFQSFTCTVRGVGVFPNERSARVVWAGVSAGSDDPLLLLAKQVASALVGYGDDQVPSALHITLARIRPAGTTTPLHSILAANKDRAFGTFTVASFDLLQSTLSPGGPDYKVLATFSASVSVPAQIFKKTP